MGLRLRILLLVITDEHLFYGTATMRAGVRLQQLPQLILTGRWRKVNTDIPGSLESVNSHLVIRSGWLYHHAPQEASIASEK